MSDTTYRIPETVVEDTLAYAQEVEKFLAQEISAVAFRAIRVPMGIYEQRENDTYMIRVRGAAGVFLPHQVTRVAELSERYGNGVVHVTTRQDLQIHRVLVHDTPPVLKSLLEVGLSSRGGGGNTVRNISACPRAGVCAGEAFDVRPYATALTEYLIADRSSFNLPRKFKIAFSGCSGDCALCSVADVGFFAHLEQGEPGFSVYAGGGMGADSGLSVQIEKFIPHTAIFEVAEAVKRLFDKHGDRANRHKARLRYVLQRVGTDEFRRLYQQELQSVRQDETSTPKIRINEDRVSVAQTQATTESHDPRYLDWKAAHASEQKQQGLFAVHVPLALGDIRSSDLRLLAEAADALSDGVIRTTQHQSLQLTGVPSSNLPELHDLLSRAGADLVTPRGVKVVACAGASTCKLGLCLSRGLAQALEVECDDLDVPFDDPIRVSGCPNSCGHHPIAPIGLPGAARRVKGRLIPFYTILAGGRMQEGDAKLADPVTRIPARNVPVLLKQFWLDAANNRLEGETLDDLIRRWGADHIRVLGEKFADVPSYEESPAFYRDFGSDEDFSLAGRGPGECGAGVMDVIRVDIDAARHALAQDSLYEAAVAAARALLITRGLEPGNDREVFIAFAQHLIAPGWVADHVDVRVAERAHHPLGDLLRILPE